MVKIGFYVVSFYSPCTMYLYWYFLGIENWHSVSIICNGYFKRFHCSHPFLAYLVSVVTSVSTVELKWLKLHWQIETFSIKAVFEPFTQSVLDGSLGVLVPKFSCRHSVMWHVSSCIQLLQFSYKIKSLWLYFVLVIGMSLLLAPYVCEQKIPATYHLFCAWLIFWVFVFSITKPTKWDTCTMTNLYCFWEL